MKKLIIIGILLMQAACLAQNLDSGLVGYWPFNGNAKDESGNGNDGIVNGATLTFDRCGNPNSAYYFDGVNNYISIKNSNSLKSIENSNKISVAAWIKIDKWTGAYKIKMWFPIIDKGYGWEIQTDSTNGLTIFQKDNSLSISKLVPQLNIWNFIAFSYDKGSSTVYYYLNNKKVIQKFSNDIQNSNQDDLYIAYSPLGDPEYSNGILDDIRIYNRALTDQEVLMLYNMPEKRARIFSKDITAGAGMHFHIPIKAKLNCANMLQSNLSFTAKVRFNASSFYPTHLTRGTITENTVDGNSIRTIKIQCDNVNVSDTDSVLTEIVGTVLLGDSLTPIEIVDFRWNNASIEIDTIINGSLRVRACALPISQVQLFNPPAIQIQPNPASDELEIAVTGDEEGFYSMIIFNLHGVAVETKKWYRNDKDKENFRFSSNDFSSGVYQVVLKTPWKVISKQLMVIK